MCGFVLYESDLSKKDYIEMLRSISSRGLSGYQGTFDYRGYTMCHTALPFVNLEPSVARQPLFDGTVPYVFVGEIFNWQELAEKYNIECQHDGELLHNMLKHHINCVEELDGFWTYATIRRDKPFYMTDYLSQKPLYYRTDVEAAASEIDVLLQFGENTTDEIYMSNVRKWGYDPSGRTPWKEIRQLKPGHFYYDGEEQEYWDWDNVEYNSLRTDLIEATRLRLGGQRDVSILLSGGLDSSIIYGIIDKALKRKVTAFHVENGEAEYAKMVTEDYIPVTLDDVDTHDAVRIHQVPVDLGSVKPQIAMARKLKEHKFHCVLTGDGADELFGGYRRSADYDSQMSDTFCELPYYHLPKLDRTMMDSTIELRSPFLAPSIIKYAMDLPYEQRKGLKSELILAFGDLVPDAIKERAKHPLKTDAIRKDPMEQRRINENVWRHIYEHQFKDLEHKL